MATARAGLGIGIQPTNHRGPRQAGTPAITASLITQRKNKNGFLDSIALVHRTMSISHSPGFFVFPFKACRYLLSTGANEY